MERIGARVLGVFIDSLSWEEVLSRLTTWGHTRQSRYVCICNVHSVITATREPEFLAVLNNADLATSDGMPIAWTMRRLGFREQERINGPDLMWKYLAEAERLQQVVYFYGSTDETLSRLHANVMAAFPRLVVGGMRAPAFRPLSSQEEARDIQTINASGAAVVFVGLGCPKQEFWMASHRGLINSVTIGVGAAFDYHAGTLQRAPVWMQHHGLEWLFRLVREPRRLWKRYLTTNVLFLVGIFKQLILRQ